jgi:hypothetical protein
MRNKIQSPVHFELLGTGFLGSPHFQKGPIFLVSCEDRLVSRSVLLLILSGYGAAVLCTTRTFLFAASRPFRLARVSLLSNLNSAVVMLKWI